MQKRKLLLTEADLFALRNDPSLISNYDVQMMLTARHGIVAPPGYVMVSCDFSAQEIRIAGWISKDKKILEVYTTTPTIPGPDGEYPNPNADMHTITASQCCYPEIFVGKEEWEYVGIAKDSSLIDAKGDARLMGKITNFGLLYAQTAEALAKLNYLKVSQTKGWIDKHKSVYQGFHTWADQVGHLGTVRGWMMNPQGRMRWVAEDNSKGVGSSPARSAVNFQIQGTAADMAKLALFYVYNLFKNTDCKLISLIHDEVLCAVPGSYELDLNKSKLKNGMFIPAFTYSDEVEDMAKKIRQCMIKAEDEIFKGEFPSDADYAISPFWNH